MYDLPKHFVDTLLNKPELIFPHSLMVLVLLSNTNNSIQY